MPKKLHVHGLKIALQLLAALAAQRSGGSRRACLGRHISLPSLGAENPRRAQRRWRGRGVQAWDPLCPAGSSASPRGCARAWLRESLLLPRLASPGPTPVQRRGKRPGSWAHSLPGAPRGGPSQPPGRASREPLPGRERGGLLPAASSGRRPSPHPGTRTFPRTAGRLRSERWLVLAICQV